MSEPQSKYLSEVDTLIVRAAAEVLRRAAQGMVSSDVFDADKTTVELIQIGRLEAHMDAASSAISRALIALEVNAERYPPAAPEPQSLRA